MSNTTGGAAAFAAVDARRRRSRGRAGAALGIFAAALALGSQAQSNAFVPKYTGTLKKIAETKSAADIRIVGDFMTYAEYALMFRRDYPDFKEVVERAFHRLAGRREIVASTSAGSRNRFHRASASICR